MTFLRILLTVRASISPLRVITAKHIVEIHEPLDSTVILFFSELNIISTESFQTGALNLRSV